MYIGLDQIKQSFDSLKKQDGNLNIFIGILTLLLNGVRDQNYCKSDIGKASEHLDKVFYLTTPKPNRDAGVKFWHTYFSKTWISDFFNDKLHGKKIEVTHVAALLYRTREFNTADDMVKFFKSQLKYDELFDVFFDYRENITFDQLEPCSESSIFMKLGGIDVNYTLNFERANFVQKAAGDPSAGPYLQILYANMGLKKYFLISTDLDIRDSYGLNVNNQVTAINIHQIPTHGGFTAISKPFLLLAGISGTGKTRFVREQADASAAQYGIKDRENYCLVPVRPDWHEPSDLLGYISRIGEGGARYIVTDLLCFIVKAWKHVVASASAEGVAYKNLNSICPFWLCLDEMNLAPVEQYFADYLSMLETRKWENGVYSCDPLLKAAVIQKQLDEAGQADLWMKLGIADEASAGLRAFFTNNGIPLPLNLIVAGTVNMDETTHGFSRKVIDRALTIDFGEFFTNDYSQYYEADKKTAPRALGFPRLSGVYDEVAMAAVAADPDGRKTIAFLEKINTVLKDTPFQLAFRALNEILLSVVCFSPADEVHLQAAWDDFLMMKVLPRIEGDSEKLRYDGDGTGLLLQLTDLLKKELSAITVTRPDLLRAAPDGSEVEADCRSLKKLAWMQQRLENNSFTTFWP